MPQGVAYDTDAGIMATAFRFKSTIIPLVIDGAEFWVLSGLNILVCILQHLEIFKPEEYHIDLPWTLTTATGSLMTFFVCFYNKHVFERYNTLYDLAKRMEECCLEIVSALRVQVPDREVQRKVSKLVMVSCFLFFYERTGSSVGESSNAESKVSKHELYQLRNIDLLDEKEVRAVQRFCSRYKNEALPSLMLIQWCMLIIRHSTPEPDTRDDLVIGFDGSFLELRSVMAAVSKIMDLPMPFQYFHIMNMMLLLNLMLWAYALGCQGSFFAPIIYMFVQTMFQGVRELSTALSDPFGEDEVDFDINSWMKSLYRRMYSILEDPFHLEDLTVDGSKPMKDPDSSSRKINILVDREVSAEQEIQQEKRRRVRLGKQAKHPWASHDIPPGDSREMLEKDLKDRRNLWEKVQRANKVAPEVASNVNQSEKNNNDASRS